MLSVEDQWRSEWKFNLHHGESNSHHSTTPRSLSHKHTHTSASWRRYRLSSWKSWVVSTNRTKKMSPSTFVSNEFWVNFIQHKLLFFLLTLKSSLDCYEHSHFYFIGHLSYYYKTNQQKHDKRQNINIDLTNVKMTRAIKTWFLPLKLTTKNKMLMSE